MALLNGTRLGSYEIQSALGAGGMGEVYRARDSKLGRDVALKILPDVFVGDPDRLARFRREAQLLASLNHSNIAAIYGLEESNGLHALVLELVDGPTLAERIARGPVPLDEALVIARQIADALEAAHEQGIVHRDLKPGNVKIRTDGTVKVLDFGLAKLGGRAASAYSDHSPTVAPDDTQAGVIMGTAAYMSPEQAKGRPVDKRADVWAFGVVLHEMVTGRRLFGGDSTTEVLASVLKEDPRWDDVPPQLHHLLRLCLEKDPQKRLRHIGDVMALVDQTPAIPAGAAVLPAPRMTKWAWVGVTVAAVAVAGAIVVWAPWRSQSDVAAIRFEVGPAEKMTFIPGGAMAVSPDGHWMVFPAISEDGVTRYWLRSLDTVEARVLPGTETTPIAPPAAWSWDSRYVIFATFGKLKKIDIQGGPPQTMADLSGMNGAASNRDGVIVVATTPGSGPLLRVPLSGGTPTPITTLADGDIQHRWPQFLPDGRHFLYLRMSSDANKAGIYIGSIDAKPEEQSRERLLATNRQAYFAASPNGRSGHLVFLREGTLMAQPFDPVRRELSRDPTPVAEMVDSFPQATYGLFSVSDTGTLVYRGGNSSGMTLTWFNEQGVPVSTLGEPGLSANPAISPDATRVAVAVGPAGSARDIWILDAARGTNTRLTFHPASDDNPIWSPSGKYIVFSSNRSGKADLYIKPADGSGEERLLLKSDENKTPTSWSTDGRVLMLTSQSPKTGNDIWALRDPLANPGSGPAARPTPILATEFQEGQPKLSPDGRWIAHVSLESGAPEIYLRPFEPEGNASGAGAKWMISKGTGLRPNWRRDGKALLYTTSNGQLMSVDIDTKNGVQAGVPRRLFQAPGSGLANGWDIAPDGKRFLFLAAPGGTRTVPFTVVVNWAAALKK
jgi:Tol biopolymer transport system component